MPLHPQVEGLLKQFAESGGKGFSEMSVPECRATFKGMMGMLPPSAAKLADVSERKISGGPADVAVRVYTPTGNGPFPALMFFHGGGWVIGDLDTHDSVCRELSEGANCVVVAVDYRLSPESKFPAAPDDCFAATQWVAENAASLKVDPNKIGVAGDSAGGNLSAVTALRCRDQNGPKLKAQLLIYPVARIDGVASKSMEANASGYLLEKKDMEWFAGHYLESDADGVNVNASPILAKNLSGLPPALVITAEYDPLRDEGEDFADALQAAGVPTTKRRYAGAIHGFYGFYPVLDQGRDAINESCQWLKGQFA